jgi:hypothetical protein
LNKDSQAVTNTEQLNADLKETANVEQGENNVEQNKSSQTNKQSNVIKNGVFQAYLPNDAIKKEAKAEIKQKTYEQKLKELTDKIKNKNHEEKVK